DSFSYLPMKRAAKTKSDPEQSHRLAAVLKEIETKRNTVFLSVKEADTVHTTEGAFIGRIKGKTLKAHSKSLGSLTLDFSELDSVYATTAGSQKVEIDASMHGSDL